MDVSNSLVPLSTQGLGQNRPQQKSESVPRQVETISDPVRKPSDPDALERKSEALRADRVQRVNSVETAPLRNQQAVNSYQQTILAAQEYEEGVLVGIDLFV